MTKKFFRDEFIDALHNKIPHRPDLVKEVSRILKVEKEPVSRRLNGNVNFSLDEMALLARELDIALDPLIQQGTHALWIPNIFEPPWKESSMDNLAEMMEDHLAKAGKVCSPNADFGLVAGSLPVEFFMPHEALMKYFLFKWGYFFIGSEEFNDFSSWKVPDRFYRIKEKLRKHCVTNGRIMYIWDDSLVWALARELKYLSVMRVVDDDAKEEIRRELHLMLSSLETWMKGLHDDDDDDVEISFYISSVQIGADCWYLISDRGQAAFFETHFTRTSIFGDRESCYEVREWVNSLRKVSYMVSGSGHKERRLFFEEQHHIIDLLLSEGFLK